MICIGIAVAQMILSAVLGLIHGGVLGYFVAGINIVSIFLFAMGFGYYLRGEAIKEGLKKKAEEQTEQRKKAPHYEYENWMENKTKESGKHESELG